MTNTHVGSVFDLNECPHCKGTTGFRYRLYISGTQFMDWKINLEPDHVGLANGIATTFTQDDTQTKHGAYWCEDCGKQIK